MMKDAELMEILWRYHQNKDANSEAHDAIIEWAVGKLPRKKAFKYESDDGWNACREETIKRLKGGDESG